MAKGNKKTPAPKQSGVSQAVASLIVLPEGFKAKRQVILPTLNLQPGAPRTLRIDELMRVSEMKAADKAEDKAAKGKREIMEPATVAPVTDMASGEQFNMLFPKVLAGNLEEKYADGAYVGLTFYMEKLPKRPGKRYFDFRLIEVEAA